jgi:hypothetical protein
MLHNRLISVVLAIMTLFFGIAPARSQESTPPGSASSVRLRLSVNRDLGYQMLAPADWEEIHMADSVGYMASSLIGKPDRYGITVTNLHALAAHLDKQTGLVGLREFSLNPSMSTWLEGRKRFWKEQGVPFQFERSLPRGQVYVVTPAQGQIQVIANVLDQGQLLVVSLHGYGAYASRDRLAREGILADFMAITNSARAVGASHSSSGATTSDYVIASLDSDFAGAYGLPVPLTPRVASSGPLMAPLSYATYYTKYFTTGDYHCHGDTCGYDFNSQMGVSWDNATDTVGWLKEYMWYRHSNYFSKGLMRTEVSGTGGWCASGEEQYIYHTIDKWTNSNAYSVSDYYAPYYRDSRIGASTYHGMAFGDFGVIYCRWWQPFQ